MSVRQTALKAGLTEDAHQATMPLTPQVRNGSSTSCYSRGNYPQIHSRDCSEVKYERSRESQVTIRSLNQFTVQRELLHDEIKGLKKTLKTKKR